MCYIESSRYAICCPLCEGQLCMPCIRQQWYESAYPARMPCLLPGSARRECGQPPQTLRSWPWWISYLATPFTRIHHVFLVVRRFGVYTGRLYCRRRHGGMMKRRGSSVGDNRMSCTSVVTHLGARFTHSRKNRRRRWPARRSSDHTDPNPSPRELLPTHQLLDAPPAPADCARSRPTRRNRHSRIRRRDGVKGRAVRELVVRRT